MFLLESFVLKTCTFIQEILKYNRTLKDRHHYDIINISETTASAATRLSPIQYLNIS